MNSQDIQGVRPETPREKAWANLVHEDMELAKKLGPAEKIALKTRGSLALQGMTKEERRQRKRALREVGC